MRFMNIWKQERNTTKELDITKFQDQWISSICDTTPTFTYFVKNKTRLDLTYVLVAFMNVWKQEYNPTQELNSFLKLRNVTIKSL